MKLSELIKQATKLLAKHGDLQVLGEELHSLDSIRMQKSKGEFPEEYQMPDGFKFARLEELR